MKIWVIITTSLVEVRYQERKAEYIAGIKSILKTFSDPKYKIVIVENNSKINNPVKFFHKTFLDNFKVPVLYTKNNLLLKHTINYGIPEFADVLDCIKHFSIADDDFIIKVTGRYIIADNSKFFNVVDNLDNKPYSAVLRFSQYDEPYSLVKTDNCVTGIIGLKCKYVKQIEPPEFNQRKVSIEMKWAKVIKTLDDSEICFLTELGLCIKPFSVIINSDKQFDKYYYI